MGSELINLFLLTIFIMSVLNIIKSVFQIIPFIKQGIKAPISSIDMFLIGLSVAYMIAFIIKGLGV
tara:strand:+ start:4219 stop:4416 length:198 start_codon:yes stop_codon:yes gene_type:complete